MQFYVIWSYIQHKGSCILYSGSRDLRSHPSGEGSCTHNSASCATQLPEMQTIRREKKQRKKPEQEPNYDQNPYPRFLCLLDGLTVTSTQGNNPNPSIIKILLKILQSLNVPEHYTHLETTKINGIASLHMSHITCIKLR